MTRPSRRGKNRALLTGETGTRTEDGDDVSYDAGPYTPPGASIPSGTFRLAAGGGEETAQAHGSMGATETIDLANGNYHSGTLNANCTLTFSGATTGVLCDFILELTQDGTGGWVVTFPAAVVGAAALAASLDTTLSTTSLLTFLTRDGGTTWYGFLAGSGGSSVIAIDDLSDVDTTSTPPVAGDVLTWDGSTDWVPSAPSTPSLWVPVMVEDGATGLWYVAVTGDGDAVMVEVP